jgi:hypothetical protein
MPAQDGVRLNKHQGRAPRTPPCGQQHPEESVSHPKGRSLNGTLQGGQLLTKGDVLESNRSVAAAGQHDRSEEDEEGRQHGGDRGVS